MTLLNLNKKTGDTFSAAELNTIGAAIDQNTSDIAELRDSMMYWYVDYDEGSNATALTIGGNLEVRQTYFDACGRCIVDKDGNAARLDPTDSHYFADGTAALHDGTYGQTMAYRPALYVKVVNLSSTKKRVYKSPTPMNGFTLLHGDFAEGAFMGSLVTVGEKQCLMSVADVVPKDSITMSQAWAYAQNYGTDWGLMNWTAWNADWLLANDYCKDRNVRSVLGSGITGGTDKGQSTETAYTVPMGGTLSLGDACGKVTVTAPDSTETFTPVSLFGKEDAWGRKWQFIAGNIHNGTTIYIWDDNKVVNGNPPSGVDYRTAYFINSGTTIAWRGISKVAFGEKCDMLPTAWQSSRNDTLNYGSSWYINAAGEILRGGGGASGGSACSPGCVGATYGFGHAAWNTVPRPFFYGKLKFINGKELVAMKS